MEATIQKTHFDLHVTGLGYLNRVREVKPKKGQPFWACSINGLHGEVGEPEYTRFDVIIRGDQALQRVQSLQISVKQNKKVLVAFKLGDIFPDLFVYQTGEKTGQHGVAIKGRLLQIGYTTIDGVPVDWAEAGIPDSVPV